MFLQRKFLQRDIHNHYTNYICKVYFNIFTKAIATTRDFFSWWGRISISSYNFFFFFESISSFQIRVLFGQLGSIIFCHDSQLLLIILKKCESFLNNSLPEQFANVMVFNKLSLWFPSYLPFFMKKNCGCIFYAQYKVLKDWGLWSVAHRSLLIILFSLIHLSISRNINEVINNRLYWNGKLLTYTYYINQSTIYYFRMVMTYLTK